jgi:hypothetical protein
MSTTMIIRIRSSIREIKKMRLIRRCASGLSGPSRSTAAATRPDSGPRNAAPVRAEAAQAARPMMIQAS